MSLLAFTLSASLLLALGLLVVHGRRPWRAGLGLADLATAWAAGLAVAAPALLLAGFAGLPVGAVPFLLLLACLLAAAWAVAKHEPPPLPPAAPLPTRWLTWTARAAVTAALLAVAWKLLLVAPWSWDHLAIWGVKARWFAAQGSFDPSFLAAPELARSQPQYPLGLPAAWLLLDLGSVPGRRAFQLAHLAFTAALLAALHGAALRLGRSRAVAALAVAFVALSPLCWDSESAGLADLPLALFAVAALALLASGARDRRRLAAAGLLLGFLPWVKDEGLTLAVGLAVVGVGWVWAGRGRLADAVAFLAPAVALASLARFVAWVALPPGAGFLRAGWAARVGERWAQAGELLAAMGRELAEPGFFGLWFALPLVAAVALARRRWLAAALAGVAAAQLALYGLVFFATAFDPVTHVESALYRVAAALVPLVVLAAVAATAVSGPRRSGSIDGAMSDSKTTLNPMDYLRDFAAGLSYPKLFFLTAGLFLLDFFLLDPLPFVDEALLGLLTLMLSRFKKRREEGEEPRIKNVTPE